MICSSPLKMTILLRLSPVFPFSPVGYALGTMDISATAFALGTAVGVLPGCLLYSWMGASMKDASQSGADSSGSIISICICIVSTLLVSYVAKREYSKATKSTEKERSKADATKKLKH